MAAFSTTVDNKILDHLLGTAAYTMPTTVNVALYTAAPTAAGGGTEATYTGYARVATTGLWAAASLGSKANSGALTFPLCTAGSSNITAFGLLDQTGGLLAFGLCTLSVSAGITPAFAAGQLTVSLS